jgi:hypothetical protein
MPSEKEYRFSPEAMTRIVIAGIAIGGTALGLAGGHAIDWNAQADQRDRFRDNRAELEVLESEQEENVYSLERQRADTPEGCRVFVEKYIPGGRMAIIDSEGNQQINDSAAVDDAMAHKDLPCGDDPSQVRETVLGIGRQVQNISSMDAKIQTKEQQGDELRTVDTYGKQTGASILGFTGLLSGGLFSYEIERKIRDRRLYSRKKR